MEQQINIDVSQLKDRVCNKCKGMAFSHLLLLKEVPALLSPSGKAETMMLPAGFFCVGCGTVIPLKPEKPKTEEPPKEEKSKIILVGG